MNPEPVAPRPPPRKDAPPPGYTRLRLLIGYEGTAFDGWQSQRHGRTVQDALEAAFASLIGHRACVHGSGRTDSGVHATGQVAHVDVPKDRLTPDAWLGAINARLVPSVRILKAAHAPSGFHARFSATGKIYTYRIWNERALLPTERNRAWHTPAPIHRQTLRDAARLLEGTHDFAPFSAKRRPCEIDTVRTIHGIGIKTSGPLITLRFEGNGFLFRMVRILTGSLVRVAQGKADEAWLRAFLQNPQGPRSSFCAIAEGLYLTRVRYATHGNHTPDDEGLADAPEPSDAPLPSP